MNIHAKQPKKRKNLAFAKIVSLIWKAANFQEICFCFQNGEKLFLQELGKTSHKKIHR